MRKIPVDQNLDAYLVVGDSIKSRSKVKAWTTPAHCVGDNVIVDLTLPPESQEKPNAKVIINVAPLSRRRSVIWMCKCMGQNDDRMPVENQLCLAI